MKSPRLSSVTIFVAAVTGVAWATAASELVTTLPAHIGSWSESIVEGVGPGAETFSVEARVDPVEAEGGDLQVVLGLLVCQSVFF